MGAVVEVEVEGGGSAVRCRRWSSGVWLMDLAVGTFCAVAAGRSARRLGGGPCVATGPAVHDDLRYSATSMFQVQSVTEAISRQLPLLPAPAQKGRQEASRTGEA